MNEIPIKLEFPLLYRICEDKDCLVCECWEGDGWRVTFRRPLGDRDMSEWERMMDLLDNYQITVGTDEYLWTPDKSGSYSTSSMYRRLKFRGVNNK